MATKGDIPIIDITMREENIADVVDKVVERIRPQWNREEMVIKRNREGFVNITVIVSRGSESGPEDCIVVRTLSERFGGPIQPQHNVCRFLHDNDLGSAMLAFFTNGIVMEHVTGHILKWSEYALLEDPTFWRPIAHTLAKWHQRSLLHKAEGENITEPSCLLWGPVVGNEWDRVMELPVMAEHRADFPTATELLNEERYVIERLRNDGELDRAFCHLDANISNIALNKDNVAVLIDYDYAAISYVQIDLAWYFHILQDINNASLDQYPDEQYRRMFLQEYLKHRKSLDNEPEVTQAELERLLRQVEKARLIQYMRSVVDGPITVYHCSTSTFLTLSKLAWKTYKEIRDQVLNQKTLR